MGTTPLFMLGPAMFDGFKLWLHLKFFKSKPTKEKHIYLDANYESLKVYAIKLPTKSEAEALDDAKIFTYNDHFYFNNDSQNCDRQMEAS